MAEKVQKLLKNSKDYAFKVLLMEETSRTLNSGPRNAKNLPHFATESENTLNFYYVKKVHNLAEVGR